MRTVLIVAFAWLALAGVVAFLVGHALGMRDRIESRWVRDEAVRRTFREES